MRTLGFGLAALAVTLGLSPPAQAQGVTAALAGTWTLSAVERPAGARAAPGANPRGLLVFDTAGHVCEIVANAPRPVYAGAQPTADEALAAFLDYGGFWGGFRVDERARRIVYRPDGALHPNIMGADLARSFELAGNRLTITALDGEPVTPAGTRWTWTRVPPLDGLSPALRRLSGFWQQIDEASVATATGQSQSRPTRGPSVIAYTPSGFVCVHFLPPARARFAAAMPTPAEAQAAIRGYVSYIAALAVHPGFIYHHQLTVLAPLPATSLQRFYEFANGDREVHYLFPPAVVNGEERRTRVVLRRLSGVAEMAVP
jgi:hypothetical protein